MKVTLQQAIKGNEIGMARMRQESAELRQQAAAQTTTADAIDKEIELRAQLLDAMRRLESHCKNDNETITWFIPNE